MRLFASLLLTLTAAAAPANQPTVEVFLPPVTSLDLHFVFQRARTVVSDTYAHIGVHVVWLTKSSPSSCSHEPLRRVIVVEFRSSAPLGIHPEAAGFARPYATEGPCVTLLTDQLSAAAKTNPAGTGALLGYVLAHEMGHVLQRVARHSATGLMKSRVSPLEIMNMTKEEMRFSEFDVQMILDGFSVQTATPPAKPAELTERSQCKLRCSATGPEASFR